MSELLVFDKNDNLLAILSNQAEGACHFWNATFKEVVNGGSFFQFTAVADHEDSKYLVHENQVAFMDKDGEFRLFVIKEPERMNGSEGPIIQALCEQAMLELAEEIITDRRLEGYNLPTAVTIALEGTRWNLAVVAELGINSTNFYYINVIEALGIIMDTWGGEIRDRIEVKDNRIVGRYIDILPRRGSDTGKIWEIDKDILSITHKVESYPKTALYGRGASIPVEDEEGTLTGGHTRKISFAGVSLSKERGDLFDKPLGQEWVGDHTALSVFGRKNYDGTLRHRFGIYENSDMQTPMELLVATWEALQQQKTPIENYEMDVLVLEDLIGYEHEKIRLGDTTIAIDRTFAEPIEIEERVVSYEYDISDPNSIARIELGRHIDLYGSNDDRLTKIESIVNDRSGLWDSGGGPITDDRIVDITPGKVTNLVVTGAFKIIALEWDYNNALYVANYEIYASQVKDFAPDPSNLIFRGKTSGYNHGVNTDEQWYYRVRAVNTHGVAGAYSDQVVASTARVYSDDIFFGPEVAAELRELSKTAELLSKEAQEAMTTPVIEYVDSKTVEEEKARILAMNAAREDMVAVINTKAVEAQEKAAEAQAEAVRLAKLDAEAKSKAAQDEAVRLAGLETTIKVNAAQAAAEAQAKLDATTKANAAQAEAVRLAAIDAGTKADTAKADAQAEAVRLAALDATTKANAAQAEALRLAGIDAATKANAAQVEALRLAGIDAKSKADNVKTTLESSIAEKANATWVDGQLQTLATKEQLAALRVGGRNLAINTNSDAYKVYNGATFTTRQENGVWIVRAVKTSTTTMGIQQRDQHMRLEQGTKYILSFEARGSADVNLSYVYIMNSTGANTPIIRATPLSEQWKLCSYPFTFNREDVLSSVMISAGTGAANGWFEVKNIKVEKGDMATDWTPAPEDIFGTIDTKANTSDVYTIVEVDKRFDNVVSVQAFETTQDGVVQRFVEAESRLQQTEEGLASTVSKATFEQNATTVKQTLDGKETIAGAQAKANAAESNAKMYAEPVVIKQTTAPAHLVDRLWMNTSTTPNVLYRSTGSQWVKASPTTAAEVGAYTKAEADTKLSGKANVTSVTAVETRMTTAETNISQTNIKIELKANKSDVYTKTETDGTLTGIENRIKSSETAITQAAESISLKANSSDTYTKAQTDTKVNAKANTSDLTALTTRVTTAESSLSVLPNQIASKVAQTTYDTKVNALQTDIDTKAKQADLTATNARVTTAESSITQQAGLIEQRVTKTEFDNLQIGGRNLLPDTDYYYQKTFTSQGTVSFPLKNPTVILNTIKELGNTEVTLSFDYEASNVKSGRVGFEISFVDDKGIYHYVAIWKNFYANSPEAEKGRQFLTRVLPSANLVGIVNSNYYLQNITSGTASVGRAKMEKGNKGTDWTPAPEDIESRVTTAETAITQTESAITLKANATDVYTKAQTDTKVNAKANTSDLTALTTRVTTAESSLSVLPNQIASKVAQTTYDTKVGALQTDIDGRAKQADLTATNARVTTAESSITQQAGLIEQRVTKTEFDNLQIGGVNLLPNSNDFSIFEPYQGAVRTLMPNVSVPEWGAKDATTLVFTGGTNILKTTPTATVGFFKEATISVWIRNNGTTEVIFQANGLFPTSELNGVSVSVVIPAGAIGKYSLTGFSRKDYDWIQAQFRAPTVDGNVNITMWHLMVEHGNKSTGWSPAPEDIDKRISTAETAITQTESAITLKANATDVYTKGQTDTKVDAKADTSTVNALATRVSTAESSLTVLPTQIASKVAQTTYDTKVGALQTDINGRAKQADLTATNARVTTAESNITQQAGLIEQRVTKTEFDNLQIGGRNLVIKSDKKVSSSVYFMNSYDLSEDWVVGETYTVTVWGDVTLGQNFGIWANGSSIQVGTARKITDGLHRGTFTVTTAPAIAGQNAGLKKMNIYNYPNRENITGNIQFIQLEKGNKATDWTPAPEDIDQRISTAETAITQTESAITLKANATDVYTKAQTDTKVNAKANTSDLTALTTRVTTAESSLSVLPNQIASKVAQTTYDTKVGALQTDINGRAKQADLTATNARVTTAESSITQQAGLIEQRVTKTEFDNLQIGGRNLLIDSINNRYQSNNSVTQPIESEDVSTGIRRVRRVAPFTNNILSLYSLKTYDAEIGEQYTESIKVYPETTDISFMLRQGSPKVLCKAGVWTTVSTIVVPTAVSNRFAPLYGLDFTSTTGWVKYKDAKVEKGIKATDWSPAPEDIDKRISTAETAITQTSSAITLKANATDVYTKAQTDTKVNAKADTSALTALTTRVTTAESSLSVLPTQIASKVAQTTYDTKVNALQTDINGRAKQADLTATNARVTTAESTITQQAGLIEQRVTKTEFDNLQIGGRNLLPDTDHHYENKFTKFGTVMYPLKNPTAILDLLKEFRNTEMTLSFDYEVSNVKDGRIGFELSFMDDKGVINYIGLWKNFNADSPETEKGRQFLKRILPNANPVNILNASYYLQNITSGTAKVGRAKMEKGNKGTDWSPAPEDVDQRISTAETAITQTSSAIELKANKTDIYTKTETDTKVNAKANTSDLTALTTRVTTAESSLSVLPNQIASKVAQTTYDTKVGALQTDINGRAKQTDLNATNARVSTAESTITQQAGLIEQRVTKTEFDNLQIGGRNLAINTNSNEWIRYGTPTITHREENGTWIMRATKTATTNQGIEQASRLMRLENQEPYILSFEARGSRNGINLSYVYIMNSGAVGNTSIMKSSPITDTWVKYSYPFRFNRSDVLSGVMISENAAAIGDWFEVRNVKLEKGNKATDWTPAPEDVDARFTTAETAITQTESAITLKANATDVYTKAQTDTKVNAKANTSDLTALTTRVTTAESSLSVLPNQIASKVAQTTYDTKVGALQTDINGRAKQADLTATNARVATAESSITQQAGLIEQRVTKTEFDNLQIGGRNLARNSNVITLAGTTASGIVPTIMSDGTLKVVTTAGNGNYQLFSVNLDGIEDSFNEGDDFTVSLTIKSDNAVKAPTLYLKDIMSYTQLEGVVGPSYSTVHYTGKWRKVQTLKPHLGWGGVVGTFYIKNWKIEKGNKATDWTPAPEDVDARFTTAEAAITTQAGLINLKADSTIMTGLSSRLITAEQNINGLDGAISQRVSKTEYDNRDIRRADSGTGKTFHNVLSVRNSTNNVTGALIIRTPITAPFMTRLEISGYNYLSMNTDIELSISFYAFTTGILQHGFTSSGTYKVNRVRVARDGDNAIIIIGETNQVWNYPFVSIDKVQFSHNSPPDSVKNGWSMSIDTVIPSGLTNMTELGGMDVQGSLKTAQASITTQAGLIALKADSSVVTGLSSRVNNAEILINGLDGAISQRVTKTEFDNLQIGGRNLLKKSNRGIGTTEYTMADYEFVETIPDGTIVTLSIKGKLGTGKTHFGVYNSGGNANDFLTLVYPTDAGPDGIFRKTFVWHKGVNTNTFLRVYHMPNTVTNVASFIDWVKLEKGNKATDWSPAPDDAVERIKSTEASITTQAGLISQKVSSVDYNGEKIVGMVNLTSSLYKVSANKIELGTNSDLVIENNIVKIKKAAIGIAAIENGTITRAKLKDALIGTAQIENGTITDTLIAANANIDGAKIAKATITTAQIADATITTAKIADGTITDAKINNLSADKINAGTLTGITVQTTAYASLPRIVMGGSKFEATNGSSKITMDPQRWTDNAALKVESYWNDVNIQVFSGRNTLNSNGAALEVWALNGMEIQGNLNVYGGKNATVPTSIGNVSISAYETAEYYFGDIGRGRVVDGECVIEIDSLFAETVNTNIDYEVFLTPYGRGIVYVDLEEMQAGQFIVRGDDIPFAYEIKAKRLGYEDVRLEMTHESEVADLED